MRVGRNFATGLLAGSRLGANLLGTYYGAKDRADAESLREGLGDAGQRAQVSEEMVGQDAQAKASEIEQMQRDEFNRARDAALAQNPEDTAAADQAGLASAQQYDPAVAEAKRLGAKEKPGYAVGKETFDTPQAAQAVAAQKNTQGMADVYRQHGQPEAANRLTQQAQSLEAGALALKGAKREDAVQAAMNPLKLAQIQHEVDTWPRELERRVIAKEVSFDDAQREAGKRFVASLESTPEVAQGWIKNGFMAKISPIFKGATDISRSGDNLVVSYEDGSQKAVPHAALKRWANGGTEPVKFTTVSEGAALVAHDAKGNAKEVYRAPKTADGSKNDAAMDDASSVMDKFLDANKTMMTQFGGEEQKIRQSAVLEHQKGIGEFKRRSGRAPTREEAAILAEGAFNRATAKYKTVK